MISVSNAEQPEISVLLDGKKLSFEVPPANIDGSVLVPLRKIFESLGATIEWNGDSKTVTAVKGDTTIILTVGAKEAYKNQIPITLSVPGQIVEGNTLVPLRFVSEALGAIVGWNGETSTVTLFTKEYDVILTFPVYKYPGTAAHIKAAIEKGESAVCTIDRKGADENRQESLKGIPTKDGYDRDEWPMAMCAEGGTGADVEYVPSSDNRGSGSYIGNQLEAYTDGTRVLFVLEGGGAATPVAPATETGPKPRVQFNSCAEVKAAGKAPIRKDDPGYSTKLDRDGDGVACE